MRSPLITDSVERVLEALRCCGKHPKAAGDSGWSCCCPAHDDQNPSLSISRGDDGRALIHCHAGCSTSEVVSAIGLSMSDLYPDSPTDTVTIQRARSETSRTGSDSAVEQSKSFPTLEGAIIHTSHGFESPDSRWDYHDHEGTLVGVILRWDTQNGKRIRPVSRVDDGWALAGIPSPRPLYGLPELLGSTGYVLVCEGEKACEAARISGHTATTSPHGSNSPDKADWSVLKGRDVVILPDLDTAGETYAERVIDLVRPFARSIRLLDLRDHWPQLGTGDDIADAAELEGGDPEAIRTGIDTLIAHTDPVPPQEKDPDLANDRLEFRAFPVNVLPDPIGTYISENAHDLGCDSSFIALPVLSMLASAIGNSNVLRVNGEWTEPSIVWTCIVGDSGTSKSPALDRALAPLRKIQDRFLAEHKRDMRDSRASDDSDRPTLKRLIIDDATTESVLKLLERNPKGLLLANDELSGWFNFDRYRSSKSPSNTAPWLSMFGGRSVFVDRVTRNSVAIKRASVSVTGGIQPGILRAMLSNINVENGLAARLLFAMPPIRPKRYRPSITNEYTRQSMDSLIEKLVALRMETSTPNASEDNPEPHTLALSTYAERAFAEFFDEINEQILSEPEHIKAAWTKLTSYAIRFALIIHLVREAAQDPGIEDPTTVDEHSIRCALALVEWFKHESKRVYAMLLADEQHLEDLKAIEWIRAKGGAVTVREFARGLAKYNDSDRARRKLEQLFERRYGYWRGQPPNGRTQEFVLHGTATAISGAESIKNPQTVSGASGRDLVPSNQEES